MTICKNAVLFPSADVPSEARYAVAVVPRVEPSTTAAPLCKETAPVETSPIIIAAVAPLEWITAVKTTPAITRMSMEINDEDASNPEKNDNAF